MPERFTQDPNNNPLGIDGIPFPSQNPDNSQAAVDAFLDFTKAIEAALAQEAEDATGGGSQGDNSATSPNDTPTGGTGGAQ